MPATWMAGPPKKLLLATDLSCRCDRALDRAVMLAAEWNARLVVLHVLETPATADPVPSWRRGATPIERARRRLHRDLRSVSEVDVDVHVETGRPEEVVPELAERLGCDLVVTGVARDETLGRMFLGTTVDALVRRSPVPVLVVKSRPRDAYRHVVVASDFTDGSRHALEAVVKLWPSAALELFHAYEVPFQQFTDRPEVAREAFARQAHEDAMGFLASSDVLRASGRVPRVQCEAGPVESLLSAWVEDHGVELVAMGTEGRRGLAKFFLGSVAERLMARLPTDLLVVRSPDEG